MNTSRYFHGVGCNTQAGGVWRSGGSAGLRRRLSGVLLAAAGVLGWAGDVKAQAVPMVFSNDTGVSSSQIFIQFLGGGQVDGSFVDAFGVTRNIDANTAYSLDQITNPATGLAQVNVSDFSGRIYMNYGPYGLQNLGADQGGYTPAAATPTDPNYSTRWQYFEATIDQTTNGGSTIYADLSYIDFTAISLSMYARFSGNNTIDTSVQNGNQTTSNTQLLVNATVGSSANSTLAVMPQGASSTLPNPTFARVISPQFSADGTFHDFTNYINALGGNSTTAKLSGLFVGTGVQPTSDVATQQQIYNFLATFSGNATTGNVTLVSMPNSGNSTTPGFPGVGNSTTIVISNADLNSQNGIYGNNVPYSINGGPKTNGITNDVYGRVVGDLLAGLSFGYVGSTVPFATATGNTTIGNLTSTQWWAGGETGNPVLIGDGTGATVSWLETPAGQGIYFGGAQPNHADYYNGYAASLVPYTPAYGFPLQDRLGNNLLVYNTFTNNSTYLQLTVNADGGAPLPTSIWTGNATDGQWTSAANWNPNGIPSGNATVQFVGNHTQTVTVNTGGNVTVAGIAFNYAAGNFTIANNTITLAGDIMNSSSKTQTITSNLTLASNSTVTAAFGDLTLGGAVALSNNATARTMRFAGTHNATLSGAITDGVAAGGAIVKTGNGTLTLSGANGFSGGLQHQSGTLVLGSNTAAGTGTLALGQAPSSDPAVVQAAGGPRALANPVTVAGDTSFTGSNLFTFSGPVTLASTVVTSGNASTTYNAFTLRNSVGVEFSGAIGESLAGAVVTKSGNGTMTFSGSSPNTFTGGLAVTGGVLELNKSSGPAYGGALSIANSAIVRLLANNQTPSTNVSIADTAQLDVQSYQTAIGNLSMTGGTVAGNGTLSIASGGTILFSGEGASTASIAAGLNFGNGTVTFNTQNNAATTEMSVTGPLAGTGSFTKTGSGTLAVLGTNNTFNGTITVGQGILATSTMDASIFAANGAVSPGGAGGNTTITLRGFSTTSNATLNIFGGLAMDLGTGGASDQITVNTTNGLNLGNGTIFLFSSSGFGGNASSSFTLVSGGASSWQVAPTPSTFTFASVDIPGLTGTFSYAGNALVFNAQAGSNATWTGSGGNWTTGSNWLANQVPAPGADLFFAGSSQSVTTGGNQTTGAITFTGAGGFTLTDNTITLGGNLANNSSAVQTIASAIALNYSRTVIAGTAGLVLSGNVALSNSGIAPGTLTFNGDSSTLVSGPISDGPAEGGSVIKSGNGTLTLTGNNSFNGPLLIQQGVLAANSALALGSGVGPTSGPGIKGPNSLVFNGGTLQATGNIFSGLNRSLILNSTGTIDTNGFGVTINGTIEGTGGLAKTGNGTLTLNQANTLFENTYAGGTTVSQGTLLMNAYNVLGSTAGGTTVTSGGTLAINASVKDSGGNFNITGESLTLSGTGDGGTGALYLAASDATWDGSVTLAGNASIQGADNTLLILSREVVLGNGTLTVGGSATAVTNLTGSLSASAGGGITKTGNSTLSIGVLGSGTFSQNGTLVIGGNNLGYNGTTTVQGGILNVLNNAALGSGTSALNVQTGGTLQFMSTGDMNVAFSPAAAAISLSGNGSGGIGTLNNNTTGNTTVSGAVALAGNALVKATTGRLILAGDIDLGNSTLSTMSASVPVALTGNITGAGGISTFSTGGLNLSGNNSFTGGTTVVNGTTLTVLSNGALGSSAAGTTVATGGFLQLQGGVTVASESLTLNGTLTGTSGNNTFGGNITTSATSSIIAQGGQLNLTGNMILGSPTPTFTTATANATLALAGQLTGSGGLAVTFTGNGTTQWNGNTSGFASAVASVTNGVLASSGNYSAIQLTVGTGASSSNSTAPTFSPGGTNNITTVFVNQLNTNNGTFAMDLAPGSISDNITVSGGGPNLAGGANFLFTSTSNASGLAGGNYTLIYSPDGVNPGSLSFTAPGSLAGLSGNLSISSGAPGTVTFQVFASTPIWDGSQNNSWATASNWSVGMTPSNGSTVAFNSANATTVDTQTDRLAGGITFGSGSAPLVLANNTIQLYGAVVNQSTALQTIGSNLTLVGDASLNAASGNLSVTGPVSFGTGAASRVLTVTGSSNTAISSPITSVQSTSGSLVKSGTGILTLSGNSSFAGTTTITAGTLVVDGALGASNDVTVGAAGTLAGSGTVAGNVDVFGTLSPGNSPGIMTTGDQVWNSGGNYNWQVQHATGTPGTAFDTIQVNGTLDLSSINTGGFTINLWSLNGLGANGNVVGFTSGGSYTWTLVTASLGITGFQASDFSIQTAAANGTAGFSNPNNGSFAIVQDGNTLVLTYNTVPEPSVWALIAIGLGALLFLRRRGNLIALPARDGRVGVEPVGGEPVGVRKL